MYILFIYYYILAIQFFFVRLHISIYLLTNLNKKYLILNKYLDRRKMKMLIKIKDKIK